jgi:hypothetical protein
MPGLRPWSRACCFTLCMSSADGVKKPRVADLQIGLFNFEKGKPPEPGILLKLLSDRNCRTPHLAGKSWPAGGSDRRRDGDERGQRPVVALSLRCRVPPTKAFLSFIPEYDAGLDKGRPVPCNRGTRRIDWKWGLCHCKEIAGRHPADPSGWFGLNQPLRQ